MNLVNYGISAVPMTSEEWQAQFCTEEIKGEFSHDATCICELGLTDRSLDQNPNSSISAERGPRAGSPAGHQRRKRGAVGCTAAQAVAGGPPGERNGQYRHGERTKTAIVEWQKFSALLKNAPRWADVSNSIAPVRLNMISAL